MSTYPVLDDKPIDQWKVTELREELKRRKIPTKGLKEDLVKRLDEAIRNEKELVNEGELNNSDDLDCEPQDIQNGEEEKPETEEDEAEVPVDKSEETDNDATMVDIDDNTVDVNQGVKVQDVEATNGTSVEETVEETTIDNIVTEECEKTDSQIVITQSETESQIVITETDSEIVVTRSETSDKDSRYDEKHEDRKPPVEDVTLSPSDPNNQVPEVSPDLGFQVKCESISTDSVSINEKNKLKDNLNADNFHLELEVVKPEMVQPSSGNVSPIGGELPPLNGDKEPGKNQASLEEVDAKYATIVELSKKDDSADVGSPEKLNLDRSSGDESMEEDVLENKNIESSSKADEMEEMNEISKVNAIEEGTLVDVTTAFSPDKMDVVVEEKITSAAPLQKRKLEENVVPIIENSKRRRWNSDSIKVPSFPQSPIITVSSTTTPKEATYPTPKAASFSRSDSTLSGGGSPKERTVPPSQKAATTSLRIDRFLRPFTLKAVQELLGKTGTVCSFWMDQIKTHCYVTYSSAEEAVATRNAVYNLQWPSNGGRLLVAEFVDPQEVKNRAEAPPPQSPAAAPIISPSPKAASASASASPFQRIQPPQQQQQKLPPPPPLPLPPPPPLSNPPPFVATRGTAPLPPASARKPEPAVLTLDDLFKKTRATPRIYYLPLSQEQVAAKLKGKSTAAE